MNIRLRLTPKNYDCLAAHLTEGSSLIGVFRNLEMIHGDSEVVFAVSCSEDELKTLLDIARRHCPEAVPEIDKVRDPKS